MVRRIAALAVIVTIFATACSGNSPTSSKPSPTPLTTGSVAWTDCGAGFQCGTVQVPIDYVGFDIPNAFVVGYGLDYAEKYRNLSDICVVPRG